MITMQELYGDTSEGMIDGTPAMLITRTLEALKTGKLKHADVFSYYAKQNLEPFKALVARFGQGRLFGAQTATYPDWAAGKGYQDDLGAFCEAKATAWMAQMEDSPSWQDICKFFAKRIAPGPGIRKFLSEGPDGAGYRDTWAKVNQQEGWDWRAGQ
jgi:hypothetical protein